MQILRILGSGSSTNSNFSLQNVFDSVKKFNEAGKKTDGGIDAKAMGDKFAEQLKPIGDVIISVGMVVCVGVAIVFGIKFITASRKRTRYGKSKKTIFWFCFCNANICIGLSYLEFYCKNYIRYGFEILKINFTKEGYNEKT